jgi:hypothetical protein
MSKIFFSNSKNLHHNFMLAVSQHVSSCNEGGGLT